MAKSPSRVAQDIIDLISNDGVEVVTILWKDFYEIAGRKRLEDTTKERIKQELRKRFFLCDYGQSVIMVGKDFHGQNKVDY